MNFICSFTGKTMVLSVLERILEKSPGEISYVDLENYPFSESFLIKHQKLLNWTRLSANPNVPERVFRQFVDKLSWTEICKNQGVSEQFFRDHFDRIKDWTLLSANPVVSEKFWEEHLEKVVWYSLCGNTAISEAFFEKHRGKLTPNIAGNSNVSEAFFRKYLDKISLQWGSFATNPSISEAFLEEFRDELQVAGVYLTAQSSFDFVKRNFRGTHDDYYHISINQQIPEEFFDQHAAGLWWYWVVINPNLSEDFFERHLHRWTDAPGCWHRICTNPNLSERFFRKHLSKIYWPSFCTNIKVSEKILEENLDKISWWKLKENPGISETFWERHRDKINWRDPPYSVSIEFLEKWSPIAQDYDQISAALIRKYQAVIDSRERHNTNLTRLQKEFYFSDLAMVFSCLKK